MEKEGQITCPECGAGYAPSVLDSHLLRDHHAYAFAGVVRSIPETLATLLSQICCVTPDEAAWRAFEAIAIHECGPTVDTFLAASLTESLKRLPREQRKWTIPAMAQLVSAHSAHTRGILAELASSSEMAGRRLGWAIAACRPGLLTRDILEALARGMRESKVVERLRDLAAHPGAPALVHEYLAEREGKLLLCCSRCRLEMPRSEMIQHLWTAHGSVLDGRRVRDPWDVIDDWIGYCRQRPDPGLLLRCVELGERADPQAGLARVYRQFLKNGLPDPEARSYLLDEAVERRASLCPHCYALTPTPEQVPPARISLSHGRLSGGGYRTEIFESGIFPYVEIEMPGLRPSRLPLPGPRLTPQAAIVLFVGPLVIAALLMAISPLSLGLSPVAPVLTFLLPAIVFAVWIRLAARPMEPQTERVLKLAWSKLVPQLHADGFSLADSAFVAGLAIESMSRGGTAARTRALERILALTERAAAERPDILHHLAALRALQIADEIRQGGDPVKRTAVQVGRCFAGKLALPYADQLLALWPREWRTRAALARLRVLLLDRAFEAGFEVRNLLAAGHSASELGRVLGTEDPSEIARLRLLWSLRPRQPWDRCGEAETAFELAERADDLLGRYPDLLLYQPSSGKRRGPAPLEIILRGRGVVIEGKLFTELARTIEIQDRGSEAGSLLFIDGEKIPVRGDASEAAAQAERWLRYYFHEFVPLVAEVYHWRSPHATAILRAWGTVACPECKRPLFARPGEVGIAAE